MTNIVKPKESFDSSNVDSSSKLNKMNITNLQNCENNSRSQNLKQILLKAFRKTQKPVNEEVSFIETDNKLLIPSYSSATNLQQTRTISAVVKKTKKPVNVHEGDPYIEADNKSISSTRFFPSLRKYSSATNLQQSYENDNASQKFKRGLSPNVRITKKP
ncbi:10363_t:CDS:2, partial [Funneliformis caledonium]